jgi:hypothetical protein
MKEKKKSLKEEHEEVGKNWEYTIFSVRTNVDMWSVSVEWIKQLNDLGKDGWELVAVIPLTSEGSIIGKQFILKRKIVHKK